MHGLNTIKGNGEIAARQALAAEIAGYQAQGLWVAEPKELASAPVKTFKSEYDMLKWQAGNIRAAAQFNYHAPKGQA